MRTDRQTDRQTDRHDGADNRFWQFWELTQKELWLAVIICHSSSQWDVLYKNIKKNECQMTVENVTCIWILTMRFTRYIRRWADKFRLHCNIFIYIRQVGIKPVLFSRTVSLFHHTSPWTHRCLQFSPSAHRNVRIFRRSVQIACCYWILNRGKSSSNWNSQRNSSRLWWSVCWCEYSETMGKAVQRGRGSWFTGLV